MPGLKATVIEGGDIDAKSLTATSVTMTRGNPIIVQGALQADRWTGCTDILSRVRTPGRFARIRRDVGRDKFDGFEQSHRKAQIISFTSVAPEG
jgi:hypothetical protein